MSTVLDPRPDLTEDSETWVQLLGMAGDNELGWTLQGFRCYGTRLIKGKRSYLLRPLVGDELWPSPEAYAACRERYLRPHETELVTLLRALKTQEDKGQ